MPSLVRTTHHRGFARSTSGMLPSTAVDGCMDRVVVDFPVSGHCTHGFFPDSVSEEDARVSASVPLVCCVPRHGSWVLLSNVWLWKGGTCASVCAIWQWNSVSQVECGKVVRGQSVVQVDS